MQYLNKYQQLLTKIHNDQQVDSIVTNPFLHILPGQIILMIMKWKAALSRKNFITWSKFSPWPTKFLSAPWNQVRYSFFNLYCLILFNFPPLKVQRWKYWPVIGYYSLKVSHFITEYYHIQILNENNDNYRAIHKFKVLRYKSLFFFHFLLSFQASSFSCVQFLI